MSRALDIPVAEPLVTSGSSTSEWYQGIHHPAPTRNLPSVQAKKPPPPHREPEIIDLTADSPPPSPPKPTPPRNWFATQKSSHKSAAVSIARMPGSTVKTPHYVLDDENKGHQLLRGMGWEGQALGNGRTAPVATALKLDRRGLGNDQSKAKVTHTQRDLAKARR